MESYCLSCRSRTYKLVGCHSDRGFKRSEMTQPSAFVAAGCFMLVWCIRALKLGFRGSWCWQATSSDQEWLFQLDRNGLPHCSLKLSGLSVQHLRSWLHCQQFVSSLWSSSLCIPNEHPTECTQLYSHLWHPSTVTGDAKKSKVAINESVLICLIYGNVSDPLAWLKGVRKMKSVSVSRSESRSRLKLYTSKRKCLQTVGKYST